MKEFNGFEEESEALILGEDEVSEIMSKFSIETKETPEYKNKVKRQYSTWTKKHREWKKKNKAAEKKFIAKKKNKITTLQKALKNCTEADKHKELTDELRIVKTSYFSPTTPPFPASGVTIQSQLEYLAKNEYIPKPYDEEALIELIESNNVLKTSIKVKATTTTGLGQQYRPTKDRNVADFDEKDLTEYHKQGKELLDWYNSKVEAGKKFYQVATETNMGSIGVGTGYFEIIEDRAGRISQLKFVPSVNIWEGVERDRYIYIKNGKKKYFKKYYDNTVRDVNTFKKGASFKNRATKLLPLKIFNLVSQVYGVADWTGAIPEILGRRYAAETNVNTFVNGAVPKLIVSISGGAVDETTKSNMKKFFSKAKGRANAGRVLIMTISSKNQLRPDAKPPVVSFEPLTVGKTEDGNFMKYTDACDAAVLKAFRLSGNFLGDSANSNRASSFTLRDLITQSVILPAGEVVANLCNDTFTVTFGIEKGYITLDEFGEIIEDNLLAELMFIPIQTMSQKDKSELQLAQLNSGALTVDEFRAEILGLPKLGTWLGSVSKTIAISMLQLSETSPVLVGSLLNDPDLAAAIKADMKADEIKLDDTSVLDDTTKAIMQMRKGLNKILTHEHISETTQNMTSSFYKNLIELSSEEDKAMIEQLFKVEE